jgi:hypothetical protein
MCPTSLAAQGTRSFQNAIRQRVAGADEVARKPGCPSGKVRRGGRDREATRWQTRPDVATVPEWKNGRLRVMLARATLGANHDPR